MRLRVVAPADAADADRDVSDLGVACLSDPVNASCTPNGLNVPSNFGKVGGIARIDSVRRVADFLRMRHPIKTAECVGALTGLQAGTVAKWLDYGCAPSWMATLALAAAYGPEVLRAAFGDTVPVWLDRAAREAELARVNEEMAALQAKRNDLLSR